MAKAKKKKQGMPRNKQTVAKNLKRIEKNALIIKKYEENEIR